MRGEDGDVPGVDGCHGEIGLVVVAELPQGALRGHLAGRVDDGSRSRLAELLDGILGHGVPVRLGEGVVVVPGDEDGHDGGHEHEALDAGLFVGRLEGPLRADDGVTKHGIGVGKVHGDGGCEMGDSVDTLCGCQLLSSKQQIFGPFSGQAYLLPPRQRRPRPQCRGQWQTGAYRRTGEERRRWLWSMPGSGQCL